MKTVGLPIPQKENENRRTLMPLDLQSIKNKQCIYIERGYGDVLGYTDEDYAKFGVNVVEREVVLSKDIICDPKIGDANYLHLLKNQTIFGWVHAVQNKECANHIVRQGLTSYAWEDMFEDDRHVFWRNNEIAGEAAVYHAYLCHGIFPYQTKAAVLGRGNIARGAIRILNSMGAEVVVYERRTESLFKQELGEYDVIINAILWDASRKDHIIYKEDLKRMKKGAMIIDVSCDANGGIETSIPTTIENPVYSVEGITHYVVDHTPALFWKTATGDISRIFAQYIDMLIEDKPNEVLQKALNFEKGVVLDTRILIG